MKKLINTSVFLIILGLLAGCFRPPEFPNEPSISFSSIRFVEVQNAADSLILSFEFQDGDGDVGLRPEQTGFPYHDFNFIIDSRDSVIELSDTDVVPPLFSVDPQNNRTLFSETDNRPPFICEGLNWAIGTLTIDEDTLQDTVYIEPNFFRNNIYVDIFRKVGGQYIEITDELSPGLPAGCGDNFDARIPVFSEENVDRPLSGTINYALLSQGFPIIFRSDTIRLEFFIIDQELNISNTEVTQDFVLSDIADPL